MKGRSCRILLVVVLSLICVNFGSGYFGYHGSTKSSLQIEEPTEEAVLDRDFKIKYGQELRIKGEEVKVKFTSVLEDSRCPADATCVWEGDAKIIIGLRQANTERLQMELHTNRKFTQSGKYQQYVIRLVVLDPYPRTDVERKPSDYVATLLIKKA